MHLYCPVSAPADHSKACLSSHTHQQALPPHTNAGELSPGEAGGTASTDRLQQKACLERYRQASIKIMTLLRKLAPKVVARDNAILVNACMQCHCISSLQQRLGAPSSRLAENLAARSI